MKAPWEWETDEHGIITGSSGAAIIGYDDSELIGVNGLKALPIIEHPSDEIPRFDLPESNHTERFYARLLHKDGYTVVTVKVERFRHFVDGQLSWVSGLCRIITASLVRNDKNAPAR